MKIACVAIVKNEERHIAEWIAWQFLVGFDAVMLLNNASTDRTAEVARGFAPRFDVGVYDWPSTAPDYQVRAYEFAGRQLAGAFDWVAFFDTDEFLVLDDGVDLKTLLAGRTEAAVAVNWAVFGSSGHRDMPEGFITTHFVNRSTPNFPPNRHFKCILRPERMRRCLNPHSFELDGEMVDLAGRPYSQHIRGFIDTDPDYALGKLHHYFTRSYAHWVAKLARGYPDTSRRLEDFQSYDRNEVFDDSARRQASRLASLLRPGKRRTCAVVLMVKNEASDIGCWLAWYHVLGFDACIVFDDDSTDGTWEVLHAAARVQDVRISRALGSREIAYEHRQEQSYKFALQAYADEFEWLAFFDADEYLSLAQDMDVKTFLARFPDAGQVCVNWCNYGSSGHYLKPKQPPIEAYTWHGDERQPVNRHVKSFVRTGRPGPRYINMHCFDPAPARSVMANGGPVVWGEGPGIIGTAVDWSVAKVMHYQCRSMEHFIERLKQRPTLLEPWRGRVWDGYDINDVEDRAPLARAPAVRAQLAAIAGGPAERPVPDLVFDIGMSDGHDTAFYLAKGFRVVGVEPDVQMFYVLQERFAAEIADGRLVLLNLAAGARAGEIVEFFHHETAQGLSGLSRSRPEFEWGFKSYHVLTIDWRGLVDQHGVPHYAKIDIEGHELAFLGSFVGRLPLPTFISAECYQFAPVRALHALGYRRFKLIDQNPEGGFVLPERQSEGRTVDWPVFSHASGPFGRDLGGEWVDFTTMEALWREAEPQLGRTWFDCHAWMPE